MIFPIDGYAWKEKLKIVENSAESGLTLEAGIQDTRNRIENNPSCLSLFASGIWDVTSANYPIVESENGLYSASGFPQRKKKIILAFGMLARIYLQLLGIPGLRGGRMICTNKL